ncbi:MAG: HD domain-containing protein [Planctomycetota bacterium]|jgi:predicted metal-dependent HD superfamily phosphohydrolase
MVFSRDYTLFFDIKDTHPIDAQLIYRDFTHHLIELLVRLGADPDRAYAIADDLWNRMAEDGRHYHSPIHILAMFDHARHAGLPVDDTLAVAIWFHDAIIHTESELAHRNEDDTADWVVQTLIPAGLDADLVNAAADAIRSTAHHLSNDVPEEHLPLMDLDLAGLASDPLSFARQSEGVRREAPHVSDDDYNQGKVQFFLSLLDRPTIFRTSHFAPFEEVARQQVRREIQRLGGADG